jgi:NADH-quinone oxidoreductase subunit L
MIVALLVVPLLGAVATLAVRRRRGVAAAVATGACAATIAVGAAAAIAQPAGAWAWSSRLELTASVEGFARVMVVLVPAVATPVIAYAAATVHQGRSRLLALLLAFVGGMQLLVVANDLLTLLVAWELIGAISWALIGHAWTDEDNSRAAAHAFVSTRVGDLGLYLAAGMALSGTSGFGYADLADVDGVQLHVLAAGVLVAVAAKSAQLPFSPWLFSAMAGPTPVSALLHSATLVSAGAYLTIRIAPALEPTGWFHPALAVLGLATALAGGYVALTHTHAKRVLAASTSAQYGLMFVAVGAGSTAAAAAQLVTHAAFKSLLFLGAGVAMHAAGTGQLAGMRLGSALPRMALLSGVGAAALAAIPPVGAAWSKQQIAAAAAHGSWWLLAGVLAAGALSAAYATRYHLLAYGPPQDSGGDADVVRPSSVERRAVIALAGATLALSALWLPGAGKAVEQVSGGELYTGPWWEVVLALAATGAAIAAVTWRWRQDRAEHLLGGPSSVVAAGWLGIPTLSRAAIVDPTLALSRRLATVDDTVIDAGVRGTVRLTSALSRLAWRQAEWRVDTTVHGVAAAFRRGADGMRLVDEGAVDRAVHAVASATMQSATASRLSDERGIDAAVEGTAGLVGAGGHQSRKLQTGQSHHYYSMVAIGFAVIVTVLLLL